MEKLYLVKVTQIRNGLITVNGHDPEEALQNAEEVAGEMSDREFDDLCGEGNIEYAVLTEIRDEPDPNQTFLFQLGDD